MNKRHFFYSLPIIILLIVAVAGWFAADYLGNKARQEIISESQAEVLALSTYVSSTFTHIEGAIKSLAGSPWIAPALMSKREQDIEHANSALDRYNSALNASVSYMMNADGMTVASSNRNEPDSFVGRSYHFRPYFQEAANGQPGRYFALGITSGKRGFYASYPVQNRLGKVLGVVAMKKDLDDMGTFFRKYPFCFLISPDGIIFLSSKPAMVLKSFWPLDKTAQEKLIASQQFGNKLFETVFLKKEIADGTEVTLEGSDYFFSRKVIDSDGWSIVLLTPTDRIRLYKLLGILTTISVGFLIIVFSGIIYFTDRSKEAFRQSEEKYRTIIEQMDEGYFESNLAGNFTFVNEAECKNLGYTHAELIGMNSDQYADEKTIKELDHLFRALYNTGVPVKAYDVELTKKDGTKAFNEIAVSLIKNSRGNPKGYRGISRDVTERKRAEIKLRNYADEISELYNNAPCGYHSLGADGLFIRLNDTELKWIGYERDEIVGRKKWRDLLAPDSQINYDKHFPIFKKQGWINDLEFDVIRKDGSIFPVLLNSTAVWDKEGNFIESRATIFDITELKKARSGLEETNLELIRTYEELREGQAMIILQEKMASIGVLAAGVAHEIKNPLAIMLQGINYLQSAVKDNSLMTEVVARLHNAVLRADVIVKGLLSYARQDSLTLTSQDIWTLIDECLTLTEHEFRKKNIRLIRQYIPNLPPVPMDSNQIEQVFVNLLLNGIDAMPQGGTFTINARQIADAAGKNFLEITFKDTGHGIPADKINKIFDPFYTTKVVGNTGLGLSISRGIIDKHGGTIHAESKIEQGTNMIIKLPI